MNKLTDSVRIIVTDEHNPDRFLICTESDDPNNWKLPGGKFNGVDETPLDAARRELDEELSLPNVALVLLGTVMNDDAISSRHIFKTVVNPNRVIPTADIDRLRWIIKADIPEGKNRHHMAQAVDLT